MKKLLISLVLLGCFGSVYGADLSTAAMLGHCEKAFHISGAPPTDYDQGMCSRVIGFLDGFRAGAANAVSYFVWQNRDRSKPANGEALEKESNQILPKAACYPADAKPFDIIVMWRKFLNTHIDTEPQMYANSLLDAIHRTYCPLNSGDR